MQRVFIGSLLTLCALPVWAADDAAQRVGAFIADCKTNREACTNKVADLNAAMMITAPLDRKWCPGKETTDVNLVTTKVVQWLTAHPEAHNKTTSEGIEEALIQLYPCRR